MAGLEKILGEIRAQADESVRKILEEAENEAKAIRDEAGKEAEGNAERHEREAKKRVEDRLNRKVSAAALKKRQMLLAEKQKLIGEVLETAKKSFVEMPEDKYFEAMLGLVEKNALSEPGQIRFNARDLGRLPRDFASKIENTAFKKGGRLTLSKDAADIDGGFLLIYDGIEQNCSISSMFETNAEELSDEIQKILF
ncbi:MAG: hypothetical protein K6C95_05635 [Lachnospiraceae bacterium]|nr:hypothetical protein [Lachnospiraceae bacterium]